MSKEIYKKAIEKWGRVAQLEMAQEEATELALAVRKFTRNQNFKTFERLVDEMADVEITMEQIKFMFPEAEQRIQERKLFKLERLSQRVDNNDFEGVKKDANNMNLAQKMALFLDGKKAGNETNTETEKLAKQDGLIIVYGSSDDLVEFSGAIQEELNDGVILLIPKGTKVELRDKEEPKLGTWIEGSDKEAIAIQLKQDAEVFGNRIEAIYNEKNDGVWRFNTEIPHYTFNILEDGELFCVGMVINEKDLKR